MKCKDCDSFKIVCEPDSCNNGLARCVKYNVVTYFLTHKKFEKLECVEAKNDCN